MIRKYLSFLEVMINKCNQRIGELQLELGNLTLKDPQNGSLYNHGISCRISKIRALIHTLTLKRNCAIVRRYSAFPIE